MSLICNFCFYVCRSTDNCVSRSLPAIHQHVGGTLINQPTTNQKRRYMYDGCMSAHGILLYSRLCLFTAGSSPLQEYFSFRCPLLSLFIPFATAPHCPLHNDVLIFQLILRPSSATQCFYSSSCFIIREMCPSHFHFRVGYILSSV